MSDEILSSIQWKAAIKEAEWPKCAAPRLVDNSALFETRMHVYVRTMYDQIYSAKIKSTPRRCGLGMDICKVTGRRHRVSPCRSAYFASPWWLLTLDLRRRSREAALLFPES